MMGWSRERILRLFRGPVLRRHARRLPPARRSIHPQPARRRPVRRSGAGGPSCLRSTTGSSAARWTTASPEAHPKRQFAAVFNINRCIACQTCTMACKSTWTFSEGQEHMWWNNVETKPYGGYPHHWDVKHPGAARQGEPRRAGVGLGKPDDAGGAVRSVRRQDDLRGRGRARQDRRGDRLPADGRRVDRAQHLRGHAAQPPREPSCRRRASPSTRTWFFYLQRICNHCTYPACLAACPRNAIYKRPEDGIVLIDQERCRGYRKCVEAVPVQEGDVPAARRARRRSASRCYPRVEGHRPADRRRADGDALHGRLRRQDPAPGPGRGRRRRHVGGRPGQPAVLPGPRGAGGAAALPAVRHRAQRLLHPAALGAARLPAPDVRPGRRARDRALQRAVAASCWPCCSSSGRRSASSPASRSSTARRSAR